MKMTIKDQIADYICQYEDGLITEVEFCNSIANIKLPKIEFINQHGSHAQEFTLTKFGPLGPGDEGTANT